jgi:hypothetical protein
MLFMQLLLKFLPWNSILNEPPLNGFSTGMALKELKLGNLSDRLLYLGICPIFSSFLTNTGFF